MVRSDLRNMVLVTLMLVSVVVVVASAGEDEHTGQSPPGGAGGEFTTDFSRATVDFGDIISGGPPRDGIPSIDKPRFVSVSDAAAWIEGTEAVLVVGERIYPLQILMWHEIVNDTVAGVPVAVTYCPLCNTGVVFDRRHDGRVLDFGTTGRLRYSNLIMYDRQTESWWQQASGEAIAGTYAGERLRMIPVMMLAFSDAAARYPDGEVLSRETGVTRNYGQNPYRGYDTTPRPFLYRGPELDPTYNPLERVVSLEHNGEVTAVPFTVLQTEQVVSLDLGGSSFVVLWAPGTASALDASTLAGGRDVGSANAFHLDGLAGMAPAGEGRFRSNDGTIWDITGLAVSGPRRGEMLTPAVGVQNFWFSHAALVGGLN